MNPLIPATDSASLWALIATGTATAIWLEHTYRWAARLSAPVLALLIAMVLANLRLVPTEAPAYDLVGNWLVPLAIPLLLFRANLREILGTGGRMLLVFHLSAVGTNRFVLLAGVSLILATLWARPLAQVNGAEEFGTYVLSLFLFTLGLPADLVSVVTQAPLFFVFCGVIAVVNLVFTLAVGRLLRLPLEELRLAVNATLGGAPSAAAMAVGAGWPRLVLPGILVAIWGYVIGTPLGILVVELLSRR